MADIVWSGDLRLNVKVLGPIVNKIVSGVMLGNAGKVQNYARVNAPWSDRTGNARQGLMGRYSKEGDSHVITLSHSVPYGIWLETRWAGRYATIVPTLQAEAPRIMRDLAGILKRAGAVT